MTTWPTKPWGYARAVQKVLMDESNLVGAWNLQPIENTVIDDSGGGNDGTITSTAGYHRCLLGDALEFYNTDNYVDMGDVLDILTNDFTLSCWVYLKSYTRFNVFIAKSSGANGFIMMSNQTTGELRIRIGALASNIGTAVIPLNQWVHVAVSFDRDGDATGYINGESVGTVDISGESGSIDVADTLRLANASVAATRADAFILDPEYFWEIKDAGWVARKYAQGARAVQGKTDWGANESVGNETAGYLSNSPFSIQSGTWQISSDTIGGEEVKVIECIAAGIITIPTSYFRMNPTEGSYGTWEFWFNHANASTTVMQMISELSALGAEDGYRLFINSTERYGITRRDNGASTSLAYTVADYVTPGSWHKAKCQRTAGDEFSIYLDDTLVPVDSGTNPVTDTTYTNNANFMLFDMDAGDKIAYSDLRGDHSIVKYLGVV